MDVEQRQLTEGALETLLATSQGRSPQDTVIAVNDAVASHRGEAEQSDDITVLALEYTGVEHPQFSMSVPAVLEAIPEAQQAYLGFAAANELAPSISRRVQLALDEVLNNIATYAYPDRAEHFVDMTVELWPTRLVITLSDDGIPFDPTAAAVPNVAAPLDDRQYGGLGIHLVRTVMDGLEYGRHDARNVLVLTKRLDSE
jgi:anti-sigma regulatory factor (Ser/Thr protein kinase)